MAIRNIVFDIGNVLADYRWYGFLKDKGFSAMLTDVLGIRLSHKAGKLQELLSVICKSHINIEYMYAFTASTELGASVVIRVDDTDAAEKVLKDNGIAVLDNTAI